MKLPYLLVSFLPKKTRDKYIANVWDEKSDQSILDGYEDATEWIKLSRGVFKSDTLDGIAADCQRRLDKYIMPQINKRRLSI